MDDNIIKQEKEHEKTKIERKTSQNQKKSSSRTRTSSKKRKRKRRRYNYRFIGLIVLPIVLLVLIIIGVRGCGMNLKTPKKTAENYIIYAAKGDANKVKRCYGVTGEASDEIQNEISAIIEYYEAHNTKSINIISCDILFDKDEYSYVEVVYNLVTEDEKEYPCVKTFMTRNDSGKYYVLASNEITEDLAEKAKEAYQKFMTTDIYKSYTKDYNTFIKQNPGYEERIAEKMN